MTGFKVGDEVFCKYMQNNGIIVNIFKNKKYSIQVKFKKTRLIRGYTIDGRFLDHMPISLFKLKSKINNIQNSTQSQNNKNINSKLLKYNDLDILFF